MLRWYIDNMTRFDAEIALETIIGDSPYMIYSRAAVRFSFGVKRPRRYVITNCKRGKHAVYAHGASYQSAINKLKQILATGKVF